MLMASPHNPDGGTHNHSGASSPKHNDWSDYLGDYGIWHTESVALCQEQDNPAGCGKGTTTHCTAKFAFSRLKSASWKWDQPAWASTCLFHTGPNSGSLVTVAASLLASART